MLKRLLLVGCLVGSASIGLLSQALTASITPKAATVTVVVAAKTYDGNTSATVTNCTVNGVIAGDTVTCSATATFASKTAGTAKPWTAVVTKGGGDASEYSVPTSANGTADITKKTVSLSGLGVADKTYDATALATLATGGAVLTGVIAGDVVTIDTSALSATFADKHVGTGKPVVVNGSASLAGADAGNYTLTTGGGSTSALPLLQPSDVTFVGSYDSSPRSLDSPFMAGLTGRMVNGDYRLLTIDIYGNLIEQSFAGVAFGGRVDAITRSWPLDLPGGTRGVYNGIWWDEVGQRLWLTWAVDYTVDPTPSQIYTYTLNADGTSARQGPWSAAGVPAKRAYGGVQPVPLWFQQQYHVGPYATGVGGYTSLMAQGGVASLGLALFAFADPTALPANAVVPSTTLADHASGTGSTDWYASGSPTSFDRGVRLTNPINQFDGGAWLSPAPDGKGRFVWGDSYNNTGCWIDGPTKRGFVAVATLGAGHTYYQNSNLNYDSKAYELHIFDPADLGAVATGTKSPWNVQPSSTMQLTLPGMGTGGQGGGTPPAPNVVIGAARDPVGKRLYLLGTSGAGSPVNRFYVFQVN